MLGAFAYMFGNSRKDWGKLSGPGDRFRRPEKSRQSPSFFLTLALQHCHVPPYVPCPQLCEPAGLPSSIPHSTPNRSRCQILYASGRQVSEPLAPTVSTPGPAFLFQKSS